MSGKSIASMTVQDILEQPQSGIAGKATPREVFELPDTELLLEPGGVIDCSGSNLDWADPDHTIKKVDLVSDAIPHFVVAVEGDDAEAKKEQADGSSDHGGWRAFGFSYDAPIVFEPGEDESDDPRDFHDANGANVKKMVQRYRDLVDQRQMTYVTPALVAIDYAFTAEFKNDLKRAQMILGIGDGLFSDPAAFDKFLATAGPRKFIGFAAIGYGDDHDRFVAHLKQISESNPFFTYAAMTGATDPFSFALDLRLLSGTAKMAA